ncbi:hypothetical protein EDB83DRAFT_2320724 [Lactarius deliciosus]|nr:hypothetical protein EDB83DRAFT_2320724 [Lactarius deliciosus]
MHASHVSIIILAASAASPALSATLGTNEPGFSPTPAVGARSIVDDALNLIFGLFSINDDVTSGILPTRGGLDSTQEITRRLPSPFNSTFLQPIGSFDLPTSKISNATPRAVR